MPNSSCLNFFNLSATALVLPNKDESVSTEAEEIAIAPCRNKSAYF